MARYNNLTPTQEQERMHTNARACVRYFVKKMQEHEQTFDQIQAMIGFTPDRLKIQDIQTLDRAIHKMSTFLGIKQFNKK